MTLTQALREALIDRLVITEKNKIVKGRNKQNQLKMALNVVNRNNQRYQLVIFETTPLDIRVFEDFQEKAKILPVNRITYDPDFWGRIYDYRTQCLN